MATIKNSSTLSLQATSPRIEPVPLPGTFFIPGTTLINGSSAATLEANASNAISIANAANAQLTSIASDSILSPGEKPAVKLDYDAIIAEQSSLNTQATTFGITTERTNYNSAVTALTNYLGTLTGWDTIPGTDVAIVGTTFRLNFYNVYNTKQILLNKLAAVAATQAAWSGISGTGKPADYATVGATWNSNISSQPSALAAINATEGTKLSGIAAGATVGADFNANLSNKPTTVGGYSTQFGASAFSGNITGSAGLDITGQAVFRGTSSYGGSTSCLRASSPTTQTAIDANSSGMAIIGRSSGNTGVLGQGYTGVSGEALSGGVGIRGTNDYGGIAIDCLGRLNINNSTLVTNLNAQYLNGAAATTYCKFFKGNNGVATPGMSDSTIQIMFDSSMSASYRTYNNTSGSPILWIGTVSDAKLKKNIEDEELGLAFIDRLRPRSFAMKDDAKERKQHGFVAQEVRELFSSYEEDGICVENEVGTKAVGYTSLIAPLTKAIQELHAIVLQQGEEISKLKQQLRGTKK